MLRQSLENKAEKSKVSGLSSRQQILYLLNKTQENNEFILENSDDEFKTESKWIDYFKFSKQKIRDLLPKQLINQRLKQHKQSQKEYIQIKKNIYIERKKEAFSEEDGYICSCEKPKKNLYVDNWIDKINE